jgi:hypothetical protein
VKYRPRSRVIPRLSQIGNVSGNGEKDGSVADVFPALHAIAKQILIARGDVLKDQPEFDGICKGIDRALSKVDKYVDLMSRSPVYLVAVVCDPRRNLAWIKWWFNERGISSYEALSIIRDYFESFRDKSKDFLQAEEESRTMTFESWPRMATDNTETGFERCQPGDDEFREYTSRRAVDLNIDPMEWWRIHGDEFPTWKKIAMNLLSIPAVSGEIERIFSRYHTIVGSY